jgi:cholesterol oxidase
MKDSYDYIVIGSGFGGSVSARRLTEKGYKVLVIEKGKWFKAKDFPKTNLNLKKWLWLPSLRFFGIFKLTFLRHVGILSGVGVGGGSLVYANTLPQPKDDFFNSGSWQGLCNWQEELEPFYEEARRMLGVARNPSPGESDKVLGQLADIIDRKKYYEPTDVAIYFGEPDKTVKDPYFNGQGPDRAGCTFCGACMTGCRYNAKNTLDKNYLYLAQAQGCEILAENKVVDIRPLSADGAEGYEVVYKKATSFFSRKRQIKAKGVVFSGGVLGTVKLLHKLKHSSLPQLSNSIGRDIRTNNESLIGIPSVKKEKDFTTGIAIGSIVHTDKDSHLEPVRYGQGSTFWRYFMLPLAKGNNVLRRILSILATLLKAPVRHLRLLTMGKFAERTSILLFMQHLDSTLEFRQGLFGLRSRLQSGKAPTSNNPTAIKLAEKYAAIVDGEPYVALPESLLGIPTTAHILGGAVMSDNPALGVIDSSNRVFGYKNMLVCDGSMISANPGVNPSLTITAISERAMSKVPKKTA